MRCLLLSLFLVLLPTLSAAAELSIFAASSLTEALKEAAASYQQQHPGSSLQLHFAGSQTLASQIEQGAPADLFISANPAAMNRLQAAGMVKESEIIARNRLVLAVTREQAGQILTPADLARPGLLLAIGNPRVPIGSYTRQLFDNLASDPGFGAQRVTAIRANVVSEETRVKAIVAKLLLGEADAGIVYQTDLTAPSARLLVQRALPCGANPLASYPAAVLRQGQEDRARDFLNFLLAGQGRDILKRHGFLPAEQSL